MSNAEALWKTACDTLRQQIPEVSYNTWIEAALRPYTQIGNHLLLEIMMPNMSPQVIQKYEGVIRKAVTDAAGRAMEIHLVRPEDLEKTVEELQAGEKPSSGKKSLLNPKYTFDTFVVGSGNQFAQAVSLAVAEFPAKAYNPLFIYGGVGLGKTHLMHAIGNYAFELNDDIQITYITSEEFTNQLVTALQTNQTASFRDRFRKVDILLVDDIQFIAGKHSTEEEFFHTFNALRDAGKQIVMTSDKPPREIQKLEERLCSRFEGGLVADIQRPDFETRLAILRKKAEYEKLNVGDDILHLIAENIESNVRELEGSLTRLIAYSSLTRRPIDMQLASEALRELFLHPDTRVITSELIQKTISSYYSIPLEDLIGPKRNHEFTVPRQIGMYLCREMLSMSLTKIGDCFGKRHYSTVISSIEKVEEALKTTPSMATLLDDIRRQIQGN